MRRNRRIRATNRNNNYISIPNGENVRYYRTGDYLTPDQSERIRRWRTNVKHNESLDRFFDQQKRLGPLPLAHRAIIDRQCGTVSFCHYQSSLQRSYLDGFRNSPIRCFGPELLVEQCLHNESDLLILRGRYNTVVKLNQTLPNFFTLNLDELNVIYSQMKIGLSNSFEWHVLEFNDQSRLTYRMYRINDLSLQLIHQQDFCVQTLPVPSELRFAPFQMIAFRLASWHILNREHVWRPRSIEVTGEQNPYLAVAYANGVLECGTVDQFEQRSFSRHQFAAPLLEVRWLPNHHQLILSGSDNLLALYDRRRFNKPVVRYQQHCNDNVQYHPINVDIENNMIISSGTDYLVRFWRLNQEQPFHYWSLLNHYESGSSSPRAYWAKNLLDPFGKISDAMVVLTEKNISYFRYETCDY